MSREYHSSVRLDVAPLVPQVARLLDVGGGTGTMARHLKSIGRAKEIGVIDAVVDQHSDGLDFAANVDLNDAEAVARFLAENGPFDAILFLDVLEHLVDPWSIVDVFIGHLTETGVMIASIPNVRHRSVVVDLIARNRWRYADAGVLDRTHLRFFVKETAVELMQRPGMAIEQVAASPIGSRRDKLINLLTFGLLRSFFTLQYFVVARRDTNGGEGKGTDRRQRP